MRVFNRLMTGVTALATLSACAGGAHDATAQVASWRCGDQVVTLDTAGDTLHLSIGAIRHVMGPVVAASGAKYAAVADSATTLWTKGDRATLVVGGLAYPECSTF